MHEWLVSANLIYRYRSLACADVPDISLAPPERRYILARLFQLSPSSSSIATQRLNAVLAPSQFSSRMAAQPRINQDLVSKGWILTAFFKQSMAFRYSLRAK